jgi:hypothetical protein
MGLENKANHFYNAWQNLKEMTDRSYENYIVALDVVSMIEKPSFNDPTIDNKTIEIQYEIYNKLNQRLRFYQTRYESLEKARDIAFKLWINFRKKGE